MTKKATREQQARSREKRLQTAATELRVLVGETIEALEFYDSDDGHNALVLAGVVARLKRIEDEYGTIANAAAVGLEVVSIVPVKFHGARPGYIVTLYDKTKDPRHESAGDT